MKIAKLMTVVCAAGMLSLVGCNKENKGAAGDMGQKTGCCKDKASMGATGGKADCSSTCTDKSKGNMGAVQNKADCSTPCSDKSKASMGAVSTTTKSGCCSAKKAN